MLQVGTEMITHPNGIWKNKKWIVEYEFFKWINRELSGNEEGE